MFSHILRKAPNKFNERIGDSKVHPTIQISNRVNKRKVFASLCIILVIALGTIVGKSGSSRTVARASSMSGVGAGIYWDQACANRTLSLDWGLVEPGSSSTMRVYVRNEYDSAVSLWMTASNWTPRIASEYMTLIWTYSGRTLSVNEVIPVDLILTIYPNVSGITDFSLDVVITSTG